MFEVKGAPAADLTVAIVSTPEIGDTYRRGEIIELEMTFSEPVEVRGAPQLGLVMRGPLGSSGAPVLSHFVARYVRGSGTTRLVFAYTVEAGDRATGGMSLESGPERFSLNGASVTALSADGVAATVGLLNS